MQPSLLLAATLAAGAAATAVRAPGEDERLIRRHIETTYFAGAANADSVAAGRAFHPVLTMYSVRDGKLASLGAADWVSRVSQRAPDRRIPDGHPREIVNVDVSGTAAVARLRLDYPTGEITDYVSLLKIDGRWIIVGKIFDRQPAPAASSSR